jgi:hypothetical protein
VLPARSQVNLRADGPGSTYELINSTLGGTAEEVPDCGDPGFGRHITEVFDSTLGKYVFAFYMHVTPDNDRPKMLHPGYSADWRICAMTSQFP